MEWIGMSEWLREKLRWSQTEMVTASLTSSKWKSINKQIPELKQKQIHMVQNKMHNEMKLSHGTKGIESLNQFDMKWMNVRTETDMKGNWSSENYKLYRVGDGGG